MTHEAEGMDVSQLVASSSATVYGMFVEAALLCCRILSFALFCAYSSSSMSVIFSSSG